MSITKFVAATIGLFVVCAGSAFAGGGPTGLPEPGTLALVGAAVVVAVAISRRGRK